MRKLKVTIGDAEPVDAGPAENGIYTIPFPRLPPGGSVEVVFNIAAAGGDDLLVGSFTLPQAPGASAAASAVGAVTPGWIASLPTPIRNPIVLALIAFGLGVLFGHLQRRGRFAPAMATAAGAAGVLVIMVAVALSDNGQGGTRAGRHRQRE